VPVPALAEVQVALEQAVEEVAGLSGWDLKRIMRTGTVATIDNRNWELRDHVELVERFAQSRAIALDMESATIAANGFRFRVPYGTLLCVSDKPPPGQPAPGDRHPGARAPARHAARAVAFAQAAHLHGNGVSIAPSPIFPARGRIHACPRPFRRPGAVALCSRVAWKSHGARGHNPRGLFCSEGTRLWH
jgi:hypothetical protein